MSVWSRSHSDLARLARTLQDSNCRARRRLSSPASRTRSLSPKTHCSKQAATEQINPLKTGSVHDLSVDHVLFSSDDPVVNGRKDSLPMTPRVNVISIDGSESSFSDVFLQSSASDYSEVFHSLTATPDAGLCQNRDISAESRDYISPSVIISEELESQHVGQEFSFCGLVDSVSSETSPLVQPSEVLQSVDSGIGMGNFQENSELQTSPVLGDLTAGVTLNPKRKLNGLISHSAKAESSHLCVAADPSSPRLSVRSPGLLRKLKEVTSSISAIKTTQKIKGDENESQLSSKSDSFPSENGDKSVVTNDSGQAPMEEETRLTTQKHVWFSSVIEEPPLTESPDVSKSDLLQSEKKEESLVCETSLEITSFNSSLLETSSTHGNEHITAACSEAVDSSESLRADEVNSVQTADELIVVKHSSDHSTIKDIEEGMNFQQSYSEESSISAEQTNSVGDVVRSSNQHCFSGSDVHLSSCLDSVCSPSQTDSSVSESHSIGVQQTSLNSTASMIPIPSSAVDVLPPLNKSSQSVVTTSGTTLIVTTPFSVSVSHHYQSTQVDAVRSSVSVSSDPDHLTVHDLDLRLVPLSAIGIMVSANGLRHELNGQVPCLAQKTSHSATAATEQTHFVSEITQCPHTAVAVSSPPGSQSAESFQTGTEKEVSAATHQPNHEAGQSSACFSISAESPCSDRVSYHCSNNSTTSQSETAETVVSSVCDTHVQQHCVECPSDEKLSQEILQEKSTSELKSDIGKGSRENSTVEEDDISDNPCPKADAANTCSDTHSKADHTKPDAQRIEMTYEMTSVDVNVGNSFEVSSIPKLNVVDHSHPDSQLTQVTAETQTVELIPDVMNPSPEDVSVDHSFFKCDLPVTHDAHSQPDQATAETQTDQNLLDYIDHLLADISSSDSCSVSRTDCSVLSDSPSLSNLVPTDTQPVETNTCLTALTGHSSDESLTSPRTGPHSHDASHQLKQGSVGTNTSEGNSGLNVEKSACCLAHCPASCSGGEFPETSDCCTHRGVQPDKEQCHSLIKSASPLSNKEVDVVDSPLSNNCCIEQSCESVFRSSDIPYLKPETSYLRSNHKEQGEIEQKRSGEAGDTSVLSVQQTDRPSQTLGVSNFDYPQLSSLTAMDSSYSKEHNSGLHVTHIPQQLHYALGQENTIKTKNQSPYNPVTSINLCTDSGTQSLSQTLHTAAGISETSPLSTAYLSSVNGQCVSQTRRLKRPESQESESEAEKSLVSASVQVSLSGSSENRGRSSRSHRRRARTGEQGSSRKTADFSQSQTSYTSSSVDSLLSLSDNGSGSGYCSDVLNYVTSTSHSQGQGSRTVSRRRLKKLITRLQLSGQSPTPNVSGLSDFSRTVADLQHLCLFLSRNLELQTQQHLLEQQQQRLREHQQQVLKEQTAQVQQSLQEKKHLQSEEKQEESQPQNGTHLQERDQEQQNTDKEQQEQKAQEPKIQVQASPVEGGDSQGQLVKGRNSFRQLVQDPLHTKIFLKLRLLNQASQRGNHTRSRSDLKSPRPEPASQQRSSCFRPVALSGADVTPEILIQEACKNTELLERLGVDKDLFTAGREECSPDVPQEPETSKERLPCEEEGHEEGEERVEGEVSAADPKEMETPEETVLKLDEEFDKMLVDMKPHVLKLPHKSDRQRCAVWIKKLCEPPSSGITGRKNRNMYSQVMLHMLKRGSLQDPFDRRPEDGPLQPLPSYMSIYFDEPLERPGDDTEKIPDWVEGELGESVGSSLFRRSEGLGNPAATSTWVSNAGSSLHRTRQRPHTSMGITLDKDPGLSPIRGDHRQHTGYSAEDVRLEVQSSPPRSRSPTDRERRQLPDVRASRGSPESKVRQQSDMEWTRPLGASVSSTTSFAKGTLYHDETSITKSGDKEIHLRTKMVEAKYHEEKLRLQQKHDAAVQKILDRKNSEIEDVKSHYRSKTKELEETITKLERKVQTLVKEGGVMRETKDKQIGELKKMVEDSSESQRNEYEKRIHDLEADFEQQKFELQKLHTRNIQEILDDTNCRLQRMDAEYNQQASSTTNVIKDLETRVQQLMGEVDNTLSQRSALEKEKVELQSSVDKLSTDLQEQQHRTRQQDREHQKKLEGSEHEMRSLRNKTEASLEFLKQEHSIAAAKASDCISDLEQQVDYLKKALKDAEDQRQRQIRETEQVHQQDKLHLENLHDKQVRSMKKELEQLEQEMQRKMSRLEQLLHDKEGEVQKQKEVGREQATHAEKALEEFKLQVEKNQANIYADMRLQMEQVEADLKKSKQAREKQSRENGRQLDEIKYKHEHELTEMKMNFDSEKAQLLHEVHVQKEYATTEHEREMEQLREAHRNEVKAIEARFRDRQDKDEKVVSDLEVQVTELREDLVQSNQLRKQQLVELGLLREEEKQKMQRDNEAEISRIRAEGEQQRLEMQKMHSAETEKLLEKTNDRLKSIEREYMERGKKSSVTITELQNSIKLLREDIKRAKETAENRVSDVRSQSEEEKLSLKKQYASNLSMIQHELESQRSRCHNLDRQIQKMDADHEEKTTRLKLEHEEKVRGLLPGEMKRELEDTIVSLKSQVSTLQQRAAMLQEELDARLKHPLGAFGSPIKSSV